MLKEIGDMQRLCRGTMAYVAAKKPDDFVIATGKQYTVKQFINVAAKELDMKIIWKGKGARECGYFKGKKIIKIDPRYFRPTEVDSLIGDATKAKNLNGNQKLVLKN